MNTGEPGTRVENDTTVGKQSLGGGPALRGATKPPWAAFVSPGRRGATGGPGHTGAGGQSPGQELRRGVQSSNGVHRGTSGVCAGEGALPAETPGKAPPGDPEPCPRETAGSGLRPCTRVTG